MKAKTLVALTASIPGLLFGCPCFAWGNFGHTAVGEVAWDLLNPKARAAVDEMLAHSSDTLTKPDFAHRATWADQQRQATHGATAAWHYVNIPFDLSGRSDQEIAAAIESVCRRQALQVPTASQAAPTDECIVAKLDEFERDLADPKTAPDEKLLALFFVEHLVGDISQPLHAISDDDAGGNCVTVSYGRKTGKLHAYWDDQALYDGAKGYDPVLNGDLIARSITREDIRKWYGGTPTQWAVDSYKVAFSVAYANLSSGALPTCAAENSSSPIVLADAYRARAAATAREQIMKAGIRLAFVLNTTLGK
jgi:hypothetical protein